MTDLDIGDLEALLAHATAGPWEAYNTVGGIWMIADPSEEDAPLARVCNDRRRHDALLIVALRNHAPELLRLARDGLRLRDLRESGAVTSMTAEEASRFFPDADKEEGQP